MKKLLSLIPALAVCLLVAALIYGCTQQPEKPSDVPSETPTDGTENTSTVEGTVSTTTTGPNGLANFMIYSDGKEKYLFNVASSFDLVPSLGDSVSVTVKGTVTETAPAQATAQKLTVLNQFSASPLDAEVYRIENIDVTGVRQALNTDRWIFTLIKSYDDFRAYLDNNALNESVMQKLGNTQIDTLTESFFTAKNLGIFIINNGNSADTAAEGTYLQQGTMYLKIKNRTTDATLNNMTYTAYLVAFDKTTEIADGIVLTENILADNLGDLDIKTDDNATGDTPRPTEPVTENSQQRDSGTAD